MVSIFIGSFSKYSGKDLVCLGLGMKFKGDGFNVGYFKPIGVLPTRVKGEISDEDVAFFRDSLQLTDSLSQICPLVMTSDMLTQVLEGRHRKWADKIKDAYKKISKNKDIVLVSGTGNLNSGCLLGISAGQLIKDLGAKAIFVDRADSTWESLDEIMHTKEFLGESLIGIIFNRAKSSKIEYLSQKVMPYLKKKKIEVLGILPDDPILSSVSVRDLKEALGGEMLYGGDESLGLLDQAVEKLSVGAMNVESALRYFRRIKNKAVITGGDRADIQIAALETSTKCLILTGGLYPNDLILTKAAESKVPVMVVRSDTQATVDRCASIIGRLTIHDKTKFKRAVELVQNRINFSLLGEKLKLKSKY